MSEIKALLGTTRLSANESGRMIDLTSPMMSYITRGRHRLDPAVLNWLTRLAAWHRANPPPAARRLRRCRAHKSGVE